VTLALVGIRKTVALIFNELTEKPWGYGVLFPAPRSSAGYLWVSGSWDLGQASSFYPWPVECVCQPACLLLLVCQAVALVYSIVFSAWVVHFASPIISVLFVSATGFLLSSSPFLNTLSGPQLVLAFNKNKRTAVPHLFQPP